MRWNGRKTGPGFSKLLVDNNASAQVLHRTLAEKWWQSGGGPSRRNTLVDWSRSTSSQEHSSAALLNGHCMVARHKARLWIR